MFATSGAFENAQARLAPYAANLLDEFGGGGIVCVGSAGLRFEVLVPVCRLQVSFLLVTLPRCHT